MQWVARYLTHPQVVIDPATPVPKWSLNDAGKQRVESLAQGLGALGRTTQVISSDETKALETAYPIARALGVTVQVQPGMHENDRSATGFLPPAEFERVADAFFGNPTQSVRGWETAQDAQQRILSKVAECLAKAADGDVLFVGHGGVGTLLFCALSGVAIDRKYDQGPGGGGCWFEFDILTRRPASGWRPMEALLH